jgi:hypothetical protein
MEGRGPRAMAHIIRVGEQKDNGKNENAYRAGKDQLIIKT